MPAQEFNPLAQFNGGFAPRQHVKAQFAHRGDQGRNGVLGAGRDAAPFEHDRGKSALLEHLDGAVVAIPAHRAHRGECLRKVASQQAVVEWRGGQDQAVTFVETQIDDDQPRFAKQRTFIEQAGTAAVGQLVATGISAVLFRDAIGEGVDQDVACGGRPRRRDIVN